MHWAVAGTLILLAGACSTAAPADTDPALPPAPFSGMDPDTAAWWAITGDLSADSMEGRDTGSPGHARAVRFVADRWAKAGLKPAGDNGTWFQTVPLQEVRVEKEGTSFQVDPQTPGAAPVPLAFLHEISVRATDALPASVDGVLVFRGYCAAGDMGDLSGKIVLCFGARRAGLPNASDRLKAAADARAVAIVNIDDPGFIIEPARWPDAYARSITFKGAPPPANADLPVMRLSPDALRRIFLGGPQATQVETLLADGAASKPLKAFDSAMRLKATFKLSRRDFSSENVLGLLPGTDPSLSPEVVVVSAHIDGYGRGEPVKGDDLYNGAFDDAAYVATLTRLAEQRKGAGYRRSVLFAAFTGEEKGLLGATWFTQHPTVAKANLAADINLDQIRALFPLTILTMHAVNDTTLGATVKQVAGAMDIEIREDREPERNLNGRADHAPFLRIGVPATGFVFGYDPGTEAERRYREWYQVRYHRPQDDMTQPIDFDAAAKFNLFFYRLTQAVADAAQRPAFLPGSAYAPK